MSSPRDRDALEQAVVRGSELLKQSKIDQAQRAFRSALDIDPHDTRVLALLGLAHFRANELAEARPIYEQLVERAPTDASHRLNLGLVYLKLGDADRAIAALEASRALDPSQGRAVSYLGLAYARAGRYAEAYRAFLIAGQNDLAVEVEINLTAAEKDRIHGQLGRTPHGPLVDQPAVARAPTPEPRTKPPNAPPPAKRSQPIPVIPSIPDSATPEITIVREPEPPPPEPAPASPQKSPWADPNVHAIAPVRPTPPPTSPSALAGAAVHVIAPATALRMTESMQFVMPKADPAAPQEMMDGPSMISRAVASATPSATPVTRTKTGGLPPQPLSELATDDLVRPDDGDEPFEISTNGALVIRVTDRVLARLDGVHVTGGDLTYELAMRRSRGHATDEKFDHGGSQLHAISGHGYLIAVPGDHSFTAVSLDDDILYVREDLVFAFEASLRWENGNVPGLRGKLPVVQFRGDGALALRLARQLVRVKLPPQSVLFVDAERLAGWIGRVIPRAVVPPPGGPMGTTCVECTGEGVVLIDPAPAPVAAARQVEPPAPTVVAPAPAPPPEPPPAPPLASSDVADALDGLDGI